MSLDRFIKECPGLAGSIERLFGSAVASQVAVDYCMAADLGGNLEVGLTREEGVSFNPRIARIVSVVLQECGSIDPSMVRVAVYSSIRGDQVSCVPQEIRGDVKEVLGAASNNSPWVQGVCLAIQLDRVRHLHMTTASNVEKEAYLLEVAASAMLREGSGAPDPLRLKVLHAVKLQMRRLSNYVGE